MKHHVFGIEVWYNNHGDMLDVLSEEGLSTEEVLGFLTPEKHRKIEAACAVAPIKAIAVAIMRGPVGLYAQIWDEKNHSFPVDD